MKKFKFTFILWSIFYLFLFSFLIKNSFNYFDPDFGWHLQVGKEIISTATVPRINHYNFTLDGENWVDHEWLANALIYILYEKYGYIVLSIFFSIFALAVLILLNLHVQKNYLKNKPRILLMMLFTYFGLDAMSIHLGVRVQEISLLFLLLLYLIIFYYSKYKNYKILFLLPILFFVWVNLHAGFLLGIAILFFFTGIKTIEYILYKYHLNKTRILNFLSFNEVFSLKDISTFTLFTLASIIPTLFTPYGLELYSFLSDYRDSFYLIHISEWLPFHYFPFMYKQLLYSGIVVAGLFILIFTSSVKKEKMFKIDLWNFAIILLFIFLALKSRRHFPLLFISSYPFLVSFFSDFFSAPENNSFLLKFKKHKKLLLSIAITVTLLTSFQLITKTQFTNEPFKSDYYGYPISAIQFLKDNPKYDDYRMFNSYSWGGFMIWDYPQRKLFIDGRLPQYRFGEHTMLEEYYELFKEEECEKKLKEHDIKIVFLRKNSPVKFNFFEKYILGLNEIDFNDKENFLLNHLISSNDWSQVYSDDISYIYAQN